MRRGGLALVTILVLGSLAKILAPGSQSAPAGEESRSMAAASKTVPQGKGADLDAARKSADWYPTQLREKIRDFFAAEHGPELDSFEGSLKLKLNPTRKDVGDLEQACESLGNWCVPPGDRAGIRFVIATAPDPVHTHLGLFFDRTIDAIQQGATSQRNLFDRAIMPWQYDVEPASRETDEDKLLRHVRESYPGLMIFRGEANTEPLFIFVVGETPTAGINKEQFHRALEIIHEIREGRPDASSVQELDFEVLGPLFSGSLFSLRELLAQYIQDLPSDLARQRRVIPVFSTVMGTDAIESFTKAKPAQVRMTVFQEDGLTALNALLDHVCGLGYAGKDVAVLNEDDTQYGTSVKSGTPAIVKHELPTCRQDVSTVTFPRGISQFRSAYSKDLQIQSQAAQANQPQRRNLRLDLEVTGSDDDNVAPYATMQTALSQEAIMLSIVSELRRRASKFILIRATDPLDELFLARYLGAQYPDARLVVPTPDLLFAREEGGILDGTLGLNTYPVSPANLNQVCPSAPSPQIFPAFPAASSGALYNATVALLDGLPNASSRVSGGNDKNAELPSPAKQPCQLSPNFWLTIVSRNSVNPIQVLSAPSAPPYFPTSGKDAPGEHETRSGRIQTPWAFLCALCLALLVNHAWRVREGHPLGYWGIMEQSEHTKRFWKGRDWILWLGAIALAAMPVVFASSVTPFAQPVGEWTWVIAIVLWPSWFAFTAYIARDFCKTRNKPAFAGTFAFISILFAALGVVFAVSKSHDMVLWQQRTLDLASQVSPATPWFLLLAAFYTWFWFSLKAESLVDWRRPRLPDPTGLPDSYHRMTDAEASSVREVIPTFAPPPLVLAGAAVVAGLISIRWMMLGQHGIPIRSLEGMWYDGAYSLGFGLALFLLIATLLRAVVVWRKLQPLLGSLDRPGMKQALDRLKGFEWYTIWNPLESMHDEARRLYSKEIHVIERFAQSLSLAGESGNPDALRELRTGCERILNLWEKINTAVFSKILDGNQKPNLIPLLRELEEKVAETAKVAWKDFLDPAWKALPADDGNDQSTARMPDSSGAITVRGAVSESNVLLRTKIINAEIKEENQGETGPTSRPRLSAKSLLLGEEFVACVYSTFITVVLLRIRGLVFSAVVIYTALVFSSISYPFQPAAGLRTLALFLFLLGTVAIGYVYEAMHHDPTLRNMTSTDPNKFDSAFWLKVVTAGLLPLLGLLTSLFPQVGHFLYTIAAPILQATR